MSTRRLPRTARGRALPRAATDTVTWPPALRGRSPLLVVLLLGWLGGGLLATAVALVTGVRADLVYGLTHTASACVFLLLVAAVGQVQRRTRAAARPVDEPVAVVATAPVPEQPTSPEARLEPALR